MRLDEPGPYNLEALRALPAPALFERDPKVLEQLLVAWFEGETGRTLYPMQIEMLLIGMIAYLWSLMANEAQIAHLQRYAALADDAWLDQLGAQPGIETPRLVATPSTTTLRFSRAAAGPALAIPIGTGVSAGSDATVFLTQAAATIPNGALFVDVAAACATPGSAANGLVAGKIATPVETLDGVDVVANLTTSTGGVDAETTDAYRLRLCNALEKASTRGQRRGYVEQTMAYSGAIIACAAVRPQPCYIDIYPLTATGAASPALRAQIRDHLLAMQEAELLPMGDLVTVKPPVGVVLNFRLVVTVVRDRAGARLACAGAARAVLDDWSSRLAGAVAPEEVRKAAKAVDGVVNVESIGLDYRELAEYEFVDAAASVIHVDVYLVGEPQP